MAPILIALLMVAGLTLSACTTQPATPADDAADYEVVQDDSVLMDEEYTELEMEEGDMAVTEEDMERLNAEEEMTEESL